MALVLKVAAAVLTLIGAVTLYWGTNPALLSLGNTVMIVGTVVGAAGIVLFGLATVVEQLGVVAAKLDGLRTALPGAAPVETLAEPPAAVPPDQAPDRAPPVAAPPPPAVALDKLEDALMAPPPPPSPAAPAMAPTPPSRQSFGLPPLTSQAPFAAAATAGLAAAAGLASAPAEPRSADKTPDPAPPVEPPVVEPVRIEPVVAAPLRPMAPPMTAERMEDLSDEEPDDEERFAGEDKVAARPEEDPVLVHAVEDMKAEVKAAEADLASSTPSETDGTDPMASLERLLLGTSAADARAPAEPEPIPSALHRSAPDADEPTAGEDQERFDEGDADDAPPEAPGDTADAEPSALPDADDFMARLRETLSRPVVAPDMATPYRPEPPLQPEPEPVPEVPAALSIEEELERALQASLAEPAPTIPEPAAAPPSPVPPVAPPVVVPPPAAPMAAPPVMVPPPAAPVVPLRRPEPGRLESDAAPAAAPREDAMAALARDFPELNDILAPKKTAADPATSLIDDLKDIFEPQQKATPRQEPVIAAPPPPPLLREGVIAGISFRLYGDGSIEADLAEGTTRFASLKDFRAHVGG